MAESTTVVNACDVVLKLDDDSETLVDISGSSNQISMNFDHDIEAYKVFGTTWRRRLECGKDANFSLRVLYSEAASEAAAIIKDWYFTNPPGDRSFEVYVPDESAGSDRYYGEVKIASMAFELVSDAAGPIIITASLVPNGEVTLETHVS